MEFTKMFRHPNYYKELRKRNKTDQAISKLDTREVVDSVRPDPGHKLQAASSKQQAIEESVPYTDVIEAASTKPQASSTKLRKHQATSLKP